MWIERHPDRWKHEREVLDGLVYEGWVKWVEWHVDSQESSVHADVDFEAGGQLRPARLIYPFIYPSAPPRLIPREAGQRWSSHQWGTGELCLEIRADNWQKTFDGADILRSARKLLDTEGYVGEDGRAGEVAADHRFTEGQLLRWQFARLVLSDELIAETRRRGGGVWGLHLFTTIFDDSSVSVAVGLSGAPEHDRWTDHTVPDSFLQRYNRDGRITILERGDPRYLALTSPDMPCAERWAAFSSIPFDGFGILVGLLDGEIIAKFLGQEDHIHDIIKILMENQQRSPERNAVLVSKRVGILGCGSVGSKVAATLARAGVTNFFLADGDVLKVDNLVRHELDWGEVGAHKVDGLIQRLKRINPQVTVERWVNHLGSQTSTANLLHCLASLKNCDLIVETTGSGQGFVYSSDVAENDKVPMVWGRVFGGGFGGYIARSRPGLDPSPLEVRTAIYRWFETPGFPPAPPSAGIDYGADVDEQAPMIADDADVSIIAANLARMALDTLRSPSSSDYPYSAYVIGLRGEWLFEQPFETHPLAIAAGGPEASPTDSIDASSDTVDFCVKDEGD